MLKQLILVLSLSFVCNSSVQAFTFKIATLSSDGSVWMKKMRAGAKVIKEKTENRVSFKFYPGGVMGGDKNVLRKIRFGQLHGTAMTNSSLSDIYPDIQLYNLILKFRSFEQIDYVRQRMDKHLREGLQNKGLVSFGFSEIGLAYIMSTTPLYNLADLQQQKAWAPDRNKIAIQTFKAISISPIPLALRDVLMGLQTGMINTVAGTPTGALALQWHTKIKYVTDLPISYVFGVLVLNEKFFKKISAQDQAIVSEVMAQVAQDVDKQSRKDNINAIAALKSQGIEFITVEPGVVNELNNLMESANQDIIKNSGLTEDLVGQFEKHLLDFAVSSSVTKEP
ncbi:MAG: TRAP transporter substrate-binding protein DctP [Methylococcaceae bacterium]